MAQGVVGYLSNFHCSGKLVNRLSIETSASFYFIRFRMQEFTFINEFKNIDKTRSSSDTTLIDPQRLQPTDRIQKRPPRPLNSFMLYRKAFRQKLSLSKLGIPNKEISKLAAMMWNEEEEQVRCYYERMAEEEKLKHSQAHPGYKYCPRPKRKKSTGSVDKETPEEVNATSIINDDCQFSFDTPPTECLDEATLNALFNDLSDFMLPLHSKQAI